MRVNFFETQRLEARMLMPQDYTLLRQMHTDAMTMKTLGGVRSEEQTKDNLQWNIKQWEEYQIGIWLFFKKPTKQFVGIGGLRHLDIEGVLEIDLAYALLSDFWQCGYATEIASVCLNIGFEKFNFNSIVAGTQNTNFASQRIIEKLGFSFEQTLFKFGHDQFIYRLTKDQFYQKLHRDRCTECK